MTKDLSSRPETKRLFIAVPLADPSLSQLKRSVLAVKKTHQDQTIHWVPWRNYHITLAFLGTFPVVDIPVLEQIMAAAVLDLTPFQVGVRQLEGFPDRDNPRIMVAEVDPHDSLNILQDRLYQAITGAGYRLIDRDYRPHITLARPRKLAKITLPKDGNGANGSNPVDDIALYHSDPQPGGPIYTILHRCPLELG